MQNESNDRDLALNFYAQAFNTIAVCLRVEDASDVCFDEEKFAPSYELKRFKDILYELKKMSDERDTLNAKVRSQKESIFTFYVVFIMISLIFVIHMFSR